MRTPLALTVALLAACPAWAEPATRRGENPVADNLAVMEAKRDELRNRGVTLTPAEVAARYEGVEDERNAALDVLAAVELLSPSGRGSAWDEVESADDPLMPRLAGEPGPTAEDLEWATGEPVTWDRVRELLAADAAALERLAAIDSKIRPAVEEVRADFDLDLGNPPGKLYIGILLPHLNPARDLANRLKWSMLVQTVDGQHDQVATTVRRMLGIADAVESTGPALVTHLVGLGIEALTANTLVRATPHLSIGDGPDEMSPGQARETIALLLDTADVRRGWRVAVDGETVFQQNAVDYLLAGGSLRNIGGGGPGADGGIVGGLMRYRMKLSVPNDAVVMAETTLTMLDMTQPPSLPRERLARAGERDDKILDQTARYRIASILLPSWGRALTANYRARTDRHLAATALAARWYEQDQGQLPATLGALVPGYLPAVPVDPFGDGEALRYDRARGLVWSVGEDGDDQGGTSHSEMAEANPEMNWKQLQPLGYDQVARVRLGE
jgi:hypothetical protein